MVIHGGIDGFSSTILFFFCFSKCSDNNRANTILQSLFKTSTSCDVPEKIHTDLAIGGERQHSNSQSAVITGASTHNERIEHLLEGCELFSEFILFICAFKSLKHEVYLDPLNEVDIFCLHNYGIFANNQ